MSQTWVIRKNAPVGFDTFDSADLNFRSNGQHFVRISLFYDTNYDPVTETIIIACALRYFITKSSSDYVQVTSSTVVSVHGTPTGGTWSFTNEAYRNIVFEDEPTGSFLTWLLNNATRIDVPGVRCQDIHLEDKALWNQLQIAWEQGDYTAALNVLKNASLNDKQMNAAAINALTTELLRLQNQKDTGFKQDKIMVSAEPPADLADGKVYFRLIGPTTGYTVQNSYFIEILQKNGTSYDTLNPYVYATDVQLPVDFQSSGQFMSLDAIMADIAGFFL